MAAEVREYILFGFRWRILDGVAQIMVCERWVACALARAEDVRWVADGPRVEPLELDLTTPVVLPVAARLYDVA